MVSIRLPGRKHGVSLWRKGTGSPQRSSSTARKRPCFASEYSRLKRRRWEGIKQECSAAHDLAAVDPNVEIAAHDVDVGRRIPVRPGVRAVRIAERDVNAGDLLVLENVADDVVNGDVGADGEFAHAVAVLVGMTVAPELGFQLLVGAAGFPQAAVHHLDGQRSVAQVAVFLAEVIAHHAIYLATRQNSSPTPSSPRGSTR